MWILEFEDLSRNAVKRSTGADSVSGVVRFQVELDFNSDHAMNHVTC